MTYQRKEVIGNAVLYLGDCREVLPTLGKVDAVCSDPPYGQRANTNVTAGGDAKQRRELAPGTRYRPAIQRSTNRGRIGLATVWPDAIQGDDRPFDPKSTLALTDKVLLWGAHKFGDRLPRGRWLAWDKVPTGKVRDQGDGELAWCSVNPDAPLRIFRHLWDGLAIARGYETRVERAGGATALPRVHPTQKPVDLMGWCLAFLDLNPRSLVCDPYMGAGSTGLAAIAAGHRFVGCEVEPLYFDTACRRIEQAQRQGSLFGAAA